MLVSTASKLVLALATVFCMLSSTLMISSVEGNVASFIGDEECLWLLGHEHKTCRAEGMRCGCSTYCCKGSVCKGGRFWKTCHRREDESRVASFTGSVDNAEDVLTRIKELCETTFSGNDMYKEHLTKGMYSHLTVLCGDNDLDKLYEQFHGHHSEGLSTGLKGVTGTTSDTSAASTNIHCQAKLAKYIVALASATLLVHFLF